MCAISEQKSMLIVIFNLGDTIMAKAEISVNGIEITLCAKSDKDGKSVATINRIVALIRESSEKKGLKVKA